MPPKAKKKKETISPDSVIKNCSFYLRDIIGEEKSCVKESVSKLYDYIKENELLDVTNKARTSEWTEYSNLTFT
jgi:chromatin remodeling complex protein RSC6